MIDHVERKSELYTILSELGAICTEERYFQDARSSFNEQFIRYYELSYDDIERVGYLHPHFRLDIGETGIFEVWIDGKFIPNSSIQWIEGSVHLYGVLSEDYPEGTIAKVIHNKYAIDRYSTVAETDGNYTHRYVADLTQFPFCDMEHPENAVYYIADGKIQLPEVIRLSDTSLQYTCRYKKTIDMYVCSNLHGIYNIMAGRGTWIDNPYSKNCYLNIVVESDPDHPIDARFYPCITTDIDCTVRVFSDAVKYIPYPELTRVMTYPEFTTIGDPYNTDNEYIKSLQHVETMILGSDDDETILEKFKDIAPYCYRIYEQFPKFSNEQSDFLILDNQDFSRQYFYHRELRYSNGRTEKIITCRAPFEDYRDILFYGNHMFHDYKVMNTLGLPPSGIVEMKSGNPTYIIPGKYKPELFTLLKFNAAEDTMISNIGNYIDENNLLRLHTNLNRFYRNMLILRGSVLDTNGPYATEADDVNFVRVSTTEPETKDSHLWFELLVNVEPAVFESNPNLIIKSFGLDISDIPEDMREGVYSLNLPEDDGPESYTQLLYTFFEMAKRHEQHLVLQQFHIGNETDPTYGEYDHIIHGPVDQTKDSELNVLHFDNPDLKNKEEVYEIEEGIDLPPNDGKERVEGDLYFGTNPGTPLNAPSTPGDDSDIGSVLDGVYLDQDKYSLDTISYMDPDTGRAISGDVIRALSVEEKTQLVTRYITEGSDEEKELTKKLWEEYISSMDEETLNIAVYKILLTDYAFTQGWTNINPVVPDEFEFQEAPYVVSPDAPVDPTTGLYWVQLDSNDPIIIHETVKNNLKYILSVAQPTKAEIGTYWINIPSVVLQEYIEEILGTPLLEVGAELPEGTYVKVEDGPDLAMTVIDYGAHGVTENGLEIFDEVKDDSLHPVHYGDEDPNYKPKDGDIWYEFLDEIDNRVCYSDTNSMVIRVDERLLLVQFEHNNITAFAFDDIVLNFRGTMGIRYIAILADLINSGVIKLEDVNIFYRRLITGKDHFEPGLRRLYTGRSYVISTADIDTTDYSLTYSTNIGRYHIDYTDRDKVINREREALYRNVLDYSYRDIGFVSDRMILFVNGRLIPRCEYEEIAAGKVLLKNFHEQIDYLDILYSRNDENLAKLKRIAVTYYRGEDTSTSIQRPRKNKIGHMKPIHVCKKTKIGYYDVLIRDYILNGKIHRMLHYITEHPEEKDQILTEFKQKFHMIADRDLSNMNLEDSRIIIPALGDRFKYEIKEEK